jgi:hypothetical protein
VRDKIKLPRIISSWKSERKLWLKFQLNQSIFLFLSLKSVIVNFGFLNLFLDIWIQNPDPDSEYGSGSRIQAQIECGSNRIRIRIRNTDLTIRFHTSRYFTVEFLARLVSYEFIFLLFFGIFPNYLIIGGPKFFRISADIRFPGFWARFLTELFPEFQFYLFKMSCTRTYLLTCQWAYLFYFLSGIQDVIGFVSLGLQISFYSF